VSRVSTDAAGCHAPYGGILVALVRMNALTCRSEDGTSDLAARRTGRPILPRCARERRGREAVANHSGT
jgi:hypothetical protein